MIKDAIFSDCRNYRYTLRRIWDKERFEAEGACTFICLNPSTANETTDDPTVRRCINYAQDWGYPAFIMLNIFAFRATDPRLMMVQDDPTGKDNNRLILETCKESALVVAAWSNHAKHLNRGHEVELLLDHHEIDLHCLKINRDSRMPAHPLYLKKTLKPMLLKKARLRP